MTTRITGIRIAHGSGRFTAIFLSALFAAERHRSSRADHQHRKHRNRRAAASARNIHVVGAGGACVASFVGESSWGFSFRA